MAHRPLHHRADLIALVHRHAPSKACERAIDYDGATVLGGFDPPNDFSYYAVCVKALKSDRVWYFKIVVDLIDRCFYINPTTVDELQYQFWGGMENGNKSIRNGDVPRISAHLRKKAREEIYARNKK